MDTVTTIAQELLLLQGNVEDAKIMAEGAPLEIRSLLMDEIDRLAEEAHWNGKDWE